MLRQYQTLIKHRLNIRAITNLLLLKPWSMFVERNLQNVNAIQSCGKKTSRREPGRQARLTSLTQAERSLLVKSEKGAVPHAV